MVTAKLLVPLGAPPQLKAGETLPPVQPKPLNTCSLTMVPPSLMSELVKVMLCAFAALEPRALTPSAAIQLANFVIAIPPLTISGIGWLLPVLGRAIAIFGIAWKLKARCGGLRAQVRHRAMPKTPQVIVGLRRYPLRRPTRNVTHVYGFLARNAVFSPGTASWYASAAASWIRDRAWKKEKSCLAWKICLSAFGMGMIGSNEAVTFPLLLTCCLLLSYVRPSRIPR